MGYHVNLHSDGLGQLACLYTYVTTRLHAVNSQVSHCLSHCHSLFIFHSLPQSVPIFEKEKQPAQWGLHFQLGAHQGSHLPYSLSVGQHGFFFLIRERMRSLGLVGIQSSRHPSRRTKRLLGICWRTKLMGRTILSRWPHYAGARSILRDLS